MRQNLVRNLQQRNGGQTMLIFVLFMVVLFLFAGLGIDLGFAYITRARLSKAVDSAALAGARNAGKGTLTTAITIADNAFHVNYGVSGRDVTPPVPQAAFSNDAAGNLLLGVTAATSINTFFIRVLPQWSTLTVGSAATALRSKIVLSLVLDRSGSMKSNDGWTKLPPAVDQFIDLFYEGYDRASMSSFASGATTDVPMETNFKTDIENAANALVFDGDTCSDGGMTNGLAQNAPVVINPGESVVKVIVFFTDGMANTFYYNLDCGARDIGFNGPSLFDPVTGASANSGCNVPKELDSIDPTTGNITPGVVDKTSCYDLHVEAQKRARRIAWLARNQGIIVYSIGMGTLGKPGECINQFPVLNPDFLKDMANTPDAPDYDSSKQQAGYSGDYAIATDSSELNQAFQTIAGKILLRLTR